MSIASRWASQVTRAPKFTYALRKHYYTAPWDNLIENTFQFAASVESSLDRFYTGRFTTSNLQSKLRQLETTFTAALRSNFDGDLLPKLVRGTRVVPKVKDFLMRGTIAVLELDFSDETKNDPAKFNAMEQVVAENLGRDLKPCAAEDIFNVSNSPC